MKTGWTNSGKSDMSFRSSIKAEPVPASDPSFKAQAPRERSFLGADMAISGDIRSKGEVVVYGTLEGTANCDSLTIGKNAEVRGTIVAESLEVHGSLDGQVRAKKLSIQKTAHVTGEILHHSLAIEAGAFVDAKTYRLDSGDLGSAVPMSLSSDRSCEIPTRVIDARGARLMGTSAW